MACETEKVVFFTELSLNAFCPKIIMLQGHGPTVQLAVPLQELCDCVHVQDC